MTVASPSHLSPTPPGPAGDGWRWEARRVLAQVRDVLAAESSAPYDGWLAARGGRLLRERDLLLQRLARLTTLVQAGAATAVHAELARLLEDVARHQQRERDLHWDAVELELGGSD